MSKKTIITIGGLVVLFVLILSVSTLSAFAQPGFTCSTDCHGDTAAPNAPTVTSTTHPSSSGYYRSLAPVFNWVATDSAASYQSGIRGYSYAFDAIATTVPSSLSYAGTRTATYSTTNGTKYFHVKAIDNNAQWSATRHFRINIDATRPITYAPLAKSVRYGAVVAIPWKVRDSYSGGKAYVTIRIKRGSVTKKTISLGLKTIGTTQYYNYRAALPRATYRYYVYATDRARNIDSTPASNYLYIR